MTVYRLTKYNNSTHENERVSYHMSLESAMKKAEKLWPWVCLWDEKGDSWTCETDEGRDYFTYVIYPVETED